MQETDFLRQLLTLVNQPVEGLSTPAKLDLVARICGGLHQRADTGQAPLGIRIVPFITGRRPTDEAAHPGLGSSDTAAMILPPGTPGPNAAYILYTLSGLEGLSPERLAELSLDATLHFTGSDATQPTAPIPGWDRRPLEPAVLVPGPDGTPVLQPIALQDLAGRRLVLRILPEQDLLPGASWTWTAADPRVQATATDGADPFTFGHLFTQMVQVTLRVLHRGVPVDASGAQLDVCDTRRFGSLYQRILERLVAPDTARQAAAQGQPALDPAFHPWSPVLLIGSEKATLYTHALIEDIVHKRRHLTDPRWLMRVGLYLELLTCIGVFEAVKDEVGDLLTPAERRVYETSPFFAEIRRRLNPRGWHEVWELRPISFPAFGTPSTGPVSARNLLQKRKAVLAFLDIHHQDLKHAIDLAGANVHNAQETWHRVFRDAERAVLRKTPVAFPELEFLPERIKEFVLWHRNGRLKVLGVNVIPGQFSTLFGDQDGLFAAACNQYRASMNEVAEWAKHRRLMDYTGAECVPTLVSLLQAHMGGQTAMLERLQRKDGYGGSIEVDVMLPPDMQVPVADIRALLVETPLFTSLSDAELDHLAQVMRPITLGPLERITIQGREGSSLFLLAEGTLEVLVRQPDGTDELMTTLGRGKLVGEISLLTGAPRTATVRAKEGATVYELGKPQFEPIIRARPELVEHLGRLMQSHLDDTRRLARHQGGQIEDQGLTARIRRFFFG